MIDARGFLLGPVPIDAAREVAIVPLTYGRARVTIGPIGGDGVDDVW